MSTKPKDLEADIAAMIDAMDFDDGPEAPISAAQNSPRAVYLKPPANGIATVHSIDDDTWKAHEGIGSHSTAEDALNYAVNPPKTPHWSYGGHGGEGWQWFGPEEFHRDVNHTRTIVQRTVRGWKMDARTHIVQGYFKTQEEAIAAANKFINAENY